MAFGGFKETNETSMKQRVHILQIKKRLTLAEMRMEILFCQNLCRLCKNLLTKKKL